MARLKKEHKHFIIKNLAMYSTTAEVQQQVKENFGIEVSKQQISYYNPGTVQGNRELAQKLRHLFDVTRDKFLEGAIEIPIAHKQYRLKQLQKLYEKHLHSDELVEARSVLEQAAKEMGNAYTARGALESVADKGGTVNFLQQVNQKIIEANRN
jgi:hypothetical protein